MNYELSGDHKGSPYRCISQQLWITNYALWITNYSAYLAREIIFIYNFVSNKTTKSTDKCENLQLEVFFFVLFSLNEMYLW